MFAMLVCIVHSVIHIQFRQYTYSIHTASITCRNIKDVSPQPFFQSERDACLTLLTERSIMVTSSILIRRVAISCTLRAGGQPFTSINAQIDKQKIQKTYRSQNEGDGHPFPQSAGGDHHAFHIKKDDGHPPHGEKGVHLLHFEKKGGYPIHSQGWMTIMTSIASYLILMRL